MRKYLVVLALLICPVASLAEPAPKSCSGQFFDRQMPDIDTAHAKQIRLLCFSQYAVAHSGATKTPIWSAERLTTQRIRTAEGLTRKNSFHVEDRLEPNERSELSDYTGSGFDRGHISPSGDMSKITAQFQSFSLANMIPQHPCNNEVLWETIESGVRAFVLARNEVYVVTGPIFEGGSLQSIGNGVVVPTKVFKAIYVPALDKAGAYLAENTDNMDWQSISIERLQTLTGVDAFPAISKSVKTDGMGLPLPTAPKFKCRLH